MQGPQFLQAVRKAAQILYKSPNKSWRSFDETGNQSPSSGEPPLLMAEDFSYRLKDLSTPSPSTNFVAVKICPKMTLLMDEDLSLGVA